MSTLLAPGFHRNHLATATFGEVKPAEPAPSGSNAGAVAAGTAAGIILTALILAPVAMFGGGIYLAATGRVAAGVALAAGGVVIGVL